MVSFEDDDDHTLSQDGSDADETMEDITVAGGGDGANDGTGAGGDNEGDDNDDDNDNEDDNDDDDDDDEPPKTPTRRPTLLQPNGDRIKVDGDGDTDMDGQNPSIHRVAATPRAMPSPLSSMPLMPQPRPVTITAPTYDIVPTMAAPHATSINTVTATPDLRLVFSGGSDGYIRKFNWIDTVNGKSMLTVAQRHPFVDSVTKAGLLMSYWENLEEGTSLEAVHEDANNLSPVYALAVQHEALWILSGLDSGGINLQSVRHSEGQRIHTLKKHRQAISVLNMASDERSVLSGSWDKSICDWDLNTGQVKRSFDGSGGQISAIESRPASNVPVPSNEPETPVLANGTFSSNNAAPGSGSFNAGGLLNGTGPDGAAQSPSNDSLFGGGGDDDGSLFGEGTGGDGTAGGAGFGDDDDEFTRTFGASAQADLDTSVDASDVLQGGPVQPLDTTTTTTNTQSRPTDQPTTTTTTTDGPATNGVSTNGGPATAGVNGYAFDEPKREPGLGLDDDDDDKPLRATSGNNNHAVEAPAYDPAATIESTFLDASIDGSIRIWDKRQPEPVGRVLAAKGTPPWCMAAAWSIDGNSIYAGRRNGAIEEYSLHKSLREPQRTFKFPADSGAVTAVRPMPNGRHIMCASRDNLRLYDLRASTAAQRSAVPFLIVPGHRTGIVSQLYIDPTCTFMISTSGNRGWEGSHTEVLLGYEIGVPK